MGEVVGQELQRNAATEFQVFGLVYDTHTASSDLVEDAVMGDGLTYGLRGRRH
jgi:hypothetical protein